MQFKKQFGQELKQLLDQKKDCAYIGHWAYSIYLEHIEDIDLHFRDLLLSLNTMEDGPEFHLSYQELYALAHDLIEGKEVADFMSSDIILEVAMSCALHFIDSYMSMYYFLDDLYFQTFDDELGSMLGGMAVYKQGPDQKLESRDPAIVQEWLVALQSALQDDAISYQNVQLSSEQAYQSVYHYLRLYCDLGAEDTTIQLKDLIGGKIGSPELIAWMKNKWQQAIDYALHGNASEEGSGIFAEKTKLDTQDAFSILQIFLDILCQKKPQQEIIDLIVLSGTKSKEQQAIFQKWQQALDDVLEQNKVQQVTLLRAYQAIPLFLYYYFGNRALDFIELFSLQCEVKNEKAVSFRLWMVWTEAVVKYNAHLLEMLHHRVSIKTVVAKAVAIQIVRAWLQDQKSIIGADLVRGIMEDQSGLHQALDVVVSRPRSYLLGDEQLTVLEVYHAMLQVLALHGKTMQNYAVDASGKPTDLLVLLSWLQVCEQVVKV